MIERNVERHCEGAAFLWLLRDKAVCSAAYARADLAFLDERIEAHLDGLRVAGAPAWEICKRCLPIDDAGEAFVFAELAIEGGNWQELATALDASEKHPERLRGVVSALGWASWDKVEPALLAMLAPQCPPALVVLGLAGAALHRRDLIGMLDRAVASPYPPLRARALRAAGELGAKRLRRELDAALQAEDEDARFWAAWSLALFGDAGARRHLWDAAFRDTALSARALGLAARSSPPAETGAQLGSMRCWPEKMALAIEGAAASGDPAHIGWLCECLTDPELARRAALALCTITGIDLEAERARALPPEGYAAGPNDDPNDPDVSADPDDQLPWPDPGKLASLCQARRAALTPGARYLLGKPIDGPWAERVLAGASQYHRRAASLELCLAAPGQPLAETRGPAFRA